MSLIPWNPRAKQGTLMANIIAQTNKLHTRNNIPSPSSTAAIPACYCKVKHLQGAYGSLLLLQQLPQRLHLRTSVLSGLHMPCLCLLGRQLAMQLCQLSVTLCQQCSSFSARLLLLVHPLAYCLGPLLGPGCMEPSSRPQLGLHGSSSHRVHLLAHVLADLLQHLRGHLLGKECARRRPRLRPGSWGGSWGRLLFLIVKLPTVQEFAWGGCPTCRARLPCLVILPRSPLR